GGYGPLRKLQRKGGFSRNFGRHSGAMRSIELWGALAPLRISRFRVRLCEPPRNDGGRLLRGTEPHPFRCRCGWIRGMAHHHHKPEHAHHNHGSEKPAPKPRQPFSFRNFVKALGPGLITGASDDDPSGIGTYSQAGAQLGYGIGWTMLLTF